jgi:teichuronic acid biosynthesis protein TuaE
LQFLALWLLYAVLSLGWAASKEDAIRDIIFLFMAVSVIFFVVYYFNDLRSLEWFYRLWLLVFVGLIPVGIWEVTTAHHLPVSVLAGTVHPRTRFMPTTVFHNPNDYATYLALSLPFVLAWVRYSNRLIARLLGTLTLAAGLYLLVATVSRGNYLAVLVGVAFWFLILLKLRSKVKLVILVGLVALVLFIAFPENVGEILATVGVQLRGLGETPSFGYARSNLLKNALLFFYRSFGFGVGAGNAEYHMAHRGVYPTYGHVNVHNWWVEILANYGLFVFAGYVTFYLGLLLRLYLLYGRLESTTEKMLGEALLVALASFSLASISSSSIIALRAQWMLFAFALAFVNTLRLKGKSD